FLAGCLDDLGFGRPAGVPPVQARILGLTGHVGFLAELALAGAFASLVGLAGSFAAGLALLAVFAAFFTLGFAGLVAVGTLQEFAHILGALRIPLILALAAIF